MRFGVGRQPNVANTFNVKLGRLVEVAGPLSDECFQCGSQSKLIESGGSELNQANVRLKQLAIRERELDLDERAGLLVPRAEVLALVSGVTTTLVEELERQETLLAATMDRATIGAFRAARKAAQAAASAKLVELASKSLPPLRQETAAA